MLKMKVKDLYTTSFGFDHPQYFQGDGVANTHFDDCFIGVGDSERESLDDALDQAAMAGYVFTPGAGACHPLWRL